MRSLTGACVLSAAGFLPVHILPVLVAVLVAEGRASTIEAGWVSGAYMFGQLAVAIGMPILHRGALQVAHATGISVFLLMVMLASTYCGGSGLLLAWFVVGMASGVLFYLGTVFAAGFPDVALAFSLRLCVSLLTGGFALFGVRGLTGAASYADLIYGLSGSLFVALALGLALYGRGSAVLPRIPSKSGGRPSGSAPLAILHLLFAGQIGYWAFATQHGAPRLMPIDEALIAIGGCKILAAAVLLPVAYRERRRSVSSGFLAPALILIAGMLLAVNAGLMVLFVGGILLWEIGFNVLSARIQTKAVQIDPSRAGAWISAMIFLGAAIGPALQGHAITRGLQDWFICGAVLSALVPAIWEWQRRRSLARTNR